MLKQVKKWLERRRNEQPITSKANLSGREQKFRTLIENSADAISLIDERGIVIYESPSYSRVMGHKVNDRLGKNTFELVHPDDRGMLQHLFAELLQKPERISIPPLRVMHGDGSWHWIEGVANNLLSEPVVGAIVVNFRDITKRKQMEEAHRRSEEKYRLLFNNAGDAIFIHDEDGQMLEVNALAIERYGYTREEFLSMTIYQVAALEARREIPERIEKLMQHGHFAFETVHQRKDGSPIPSDVSSRRVVWDGLPAIMSICRDITERKRDEKALRESEEKFHNFVEQSSEGFALIDEQGSIIEWNRACEEITGWAFEDVKGEKFWDIQQRIVPPEEQLPGAYERRKALIQNALQTGSSPVFSTVFEAQLIKPSGERRFFRQTVFPIKTNRGYQIGFVSHDITASKLVEAQLRDSEEKYRQLFDVESDAIFLLDAVSGEILDANAAAASLYGYSREELLTMRHVDLSAEFEFTPSLQMPVKHSLLSTHYHRKKDGTQFPVEVTSNDLVWRARSVQIAAVRDNTERKLAEEALRHMSTHDTLTGIFNRTFFETELERLEPTRGFPVSIIIGDLDNLKVTNDTLGHAVGDELLKHVAQVLRDIFRAEDIIARIGGDEFAILLPNTDAETAKQMISRVQEKFTNHNIQHAELPIECSLGTSTAEHGKLMEAFVLADQRMYKNKAIRKSAHNH